MISIDLRKKKVGIVLEKRRLIGVRAQTGFAIDVSGSMEELFRRGTVQQVVERLLALALRFDDNGTMDMVAFDHRATALPPVGEADFAGYVRRAILDDRAVHKWGGTNYEGAIRLATEAWFGRPSPGGLLSRLFGARPAAPAAQPSLLLIATDGENQDPAETDALLRAMQDRPVYFSFIGIGAARFDFIREVAERYPNVGFLSVADLERISDDELYERLVSRELADWLRQSGQRG
ncbi:VWA domain-containing protein [Roseomonas sp. NAR14]|uniref:VWA domain-containing protein n=1 Tax=Roseomonas acroporae TaxID=2937791 RepID=A0A9X1Y4I5_9PROT|nr:VWA domain-containing protein [Roseomonas acroporae]MCK8783258.1 VWA domain-containing protein [Roseomonas acroporae]